MITNQNRFSGFTGIALTNALEDHADFVEEEDYLRPLNEVEKAEMTQTMIDDMAIIKKQEAELKKLVKAKKEQIKVLATAVAKNAEQLHKGAVDCTGKVYIMIDGEEAYQYDSQGNFLGTRPIRAKEKQRTIHSQTRAVNG